MKLIRPSRKFESSYRSYIEELGTEERYPFTLDLEFSDFDGLLEILSNYEKGEELPKDSVPSTTLWLVEGEKLLGVTNIRHYLNERIEECGGHIGLGVRPTARGLGLGSELMRLSIEYLIAQGVNEIHVHCYKSNVSSIKTILKNGGDLDSELLKNHETVLRYVIKK